MKQVENMERKVKAMKEIRIKKIENLNKEIVNLKNDIAVRMEKIDSLNDELEDLNSIAID